MGGANPPPHNQQPTDLDFPIQTGRPLPGGMAKRSKITQRAGAPTPTSSSAESQAQLQASKLLISRKLGTPTRKIRVKWLFKSHWLLKPLILLWCGQLLDFCSGQLLVINTMLPGSCPQNLYMYGFFWPRPRTPFNSPPKLQYLTEGTKKKKICEAALVDHSGESL